MIPVEPGRRTKRKRKREGRGGGKRGEKKEGNYDLGGPKTRATAGPNIFFDYYSKYARRKDKENGTNAT